MDLSELERHWPVSSKHGNCPDEQAAETLHMVPTRMHIGVTLAGEMGKSAMDFNDLLATKLRTFQQFYLKHNFRDAFQ